MISKDLSHNFIESQIYQLGGMIAEVCTPPFENFPINYFTYGYIDLEDNSAEERRIVMLTSDAKWMNYYLKNGHPILSRGKKIDCWQSVMPRKALKAAGENFNHYNGITLRKACIDRMEVIEFASPSPDESPIEFCSNKGMLNKFLAYFKEEAKDALSSVVNNPLYLPKDRFLRIENSKQYNENFCKVINAKRFLLRFKSREFVFTKREFEILSLLIKGKRIQEIAKILNISPRTVECCLSKVKGKTNICTVSQLVSCFSDSLF